MPDQYTDRQLTCVECQAEFTFSAGEQEHHVTLGFTNEPKRCGPCRAARKQRSGSGGSGSRDARPSQGGPKEFHVAVCTQCGGQARVPFKPTNGKPIYCSDCFGKRR